MVVVGDAAAVWIGMGGRCSGCGRGSIGIAGLAASGGEAAKHTAHFFFNIRPLSCTWTPVVGA